MRVKSVQLRVSNMKGVGLFRSRIIVDLDELPCRPQGDCIAAHATGSWYLICYLFSRNRSRRRPVTRPDREFQAAHFVPVGQRASLRIPREVEGPVGTVRIADGQGWLPPKPLRAGGGTMTVTCQRRIPARPDPSRNDCRTFVGRQRPLRLNEPGTWVWVSGCDGACSLRGMSWSIF